MGYFMISFFLIGNFTDKKKKMSESFGCFLFINLRKFILNRVCNKKKSTNSSLFIGYKNINSSCYTQSLTYSCLCHRNFK